MASGKSSASSSKQGWTQEDLDKALHSIQQVNVPIRTAARTYGIPKSTLHDHYSQKVKSSKRGPQTVLSEAEESKLANWAVKMVKIGYGRTKEQMSETVKRILDEDGRANPFVNNYPGGMDFFNAILNFPCVHQNS